MITPAQTARHDALRARCIADDEAMRAALIQAAGALLTTRAPELGGAVLAAAGRLFPDLADFRPRLLGPERAAR